MAKEPSQRPDIGGEVSRGDEPSRHGTHATIAETASAAAQSAKSAATEKMEQQKKAASQSIDVFAQAVRRASDELKNQDQTAAAQLIQQAAGGLESLSKTLSTQSLADMVNTVRDFGRRNPVVLAGGAALLGLALGRVARTAAEGSEGSNGSNGYGESPASSRYSPMESPIASSGAVTGPASVRGGSSSAGGFPASRASATQPPHPGSATGPGSSPQDSKRSGGAS